MSGDESCIRCARRMRQEIRQRLDYGDTLRVGHACDVLVTEAGFTSIGSMLDALGDCDACYWLNLVMVHWGKKSASEALCVASGFDRQGWLDMERRFRN